MFISPGPIIFQLGPFALKWYGVLIAISVLIGLNISSNLAKKRGIQSGFINDLTPILILSSIFGARIYYVIFEWRNFSGSYFWSDLNFFRLKIPIPSAFEIWGGGIAIHGALIAGTISVIIFCKLKKQNFWNVLDVLVPSVALGQSIGRWGNFFNNEAFGLPTSLPWKLFIPVINRPTLFLGQNYFHPTFLYESLWNILTFALLIYLFQLGLKGNLKLPPGSLSFVYMLSYGFVRFWIEGIRIDPLCINSVPPFCEGGLKVAQLISFLLFFAGMIGLWWIYKRQKMLTIKKFQSNKRI